MMPDCLNLQKDTCIHEKVTHNHVGIEQPPFLECVGINLVLPANLKASSSKSIAKTLNIM